MLLLLFVLSIVLFGADADTVITASSDGISTQWEDDYDYTATSDSTVNTWYDTTSGASYSLWREDTLTDSGTYSSTPVIGWYTADDSIQGLGRSFQCDRHALLEVQVDLYFCDDSSGESYWRVTGTGFGLGFSYSSSNDVYDNWTPSNYPEPSGDADGFWISARTNLGTGPSNGRTCSQGLYRIRYHERLEVAPSQGYIMAFKPWEAAGSRPLALGNMKASCTFRATPPPTRPPTDATSSPTTKPTIQPTKNPSPNPTSNPTLKPTKFPTVPRPSAAPTTLDPTRSPTSAPTDMPTGDPTWRPTDEPSLSPTEPTHAPVTPAPTEQKSAGDLFAAAFGGESDCTDGWIACNIEVFIILVFIVILCCIYPIIGCVWYKRRQNNRPLPEHLRGNNVEMGGAAKQHATADRWKSAWELEEEKKTMAQKGEHAVNDNDW
eukprot:CAMPEP_0202726172 /NCGR_PEP_ID=MMETSP1385-20130828/184478_1 /ASSEMBLY_ACC=CAM_ASM_000861 /TAXON_ID=933848 /ORGANISM="Elphidium margaritaceum" /LENGTH=434 /DNA_ID=CAMNT_0049392385 /DNA_START=1948 /DNA_END=3249 /DNA_ORIENTATION=+